MGAARFTARINTYLFPADAASPLGPVQQEQTQEGHEATLVIEWDRQPGVAEQTSPVTSLTWIVHQDPHNLGSALETLTLFPDPTNTVVQDGFYFDFVAWVGTPRGVSLRGNLCASFPVEGENDEHIAALSAVYRGDNLAALVAFGVVSGDLSGIPPFQAKTAASPAASLALVGLRPRHRPAVFLLAGSGLQDQLTHVGLGAGAIVGGHPLLGGYRRIEMAQMAQRRSLFNQRHRDVLT